MATRRGYYREELERSVDNIEMALTHLARVIDAYANDHPEVSIQVAQLGDALVEIAKLIKAVHASI